MSDPKIPDETHANEAPGSDDTGTWLLKCIEQESATFKERAEKVARSARAYKAKTSGQMAAVKPPKDPA